MADLDGTDDRLRRARQHYAAELGLGRWIVRLLAATTVLSTTAAIAAASWAVYVTERSGDRVERYVVFMDDAARPVRVDLARDTWTPAGGVWADFAARWVRGLRSRPLDVPTLEYERREVIETASLDVYPALREWMARADRDMGGSAVDVELVATNVVRADADQATVLVRWKERERRPGGQLGEWAPMSGTVTLTLKPPRLKTELERNPTGIYVVDFSFSREAA